MKINKSEIPIIVISLIQVFSLFTLSASWGKIIALISIVLGSIIAISMAPFLMLIFDQSTYYIWFAALGALYVIYMHRENIKRLKQGTESKVRK